jgi:hypothetical protein
VAGMFRHKITGKAAFKVGIVSKSEMFRNFGGSFFLGTHIIEKRYFSCAKTEGQK